MLKPTVGMELWPGVSASTNRSGTQGRAKLSIGTWTKQVVAGLRNPGVRMDVLDCKLASLQTTRSARFRSSKSRRRRTVFFPKREGTHRQNSQERSFACVLQSNHGDVHLGGPVQRERSASTSSVVGPVFAFLAQQKFPSRSNIK